MTSQVFCRQCGAQVALTAQFCGFCGEPTDSGPHPANGERESPHPPSPSTLSPGPIARMAPLTTPPHPGDTSTTPFHTEPTPSLLVCPSCSRGDCAHLCPGGCGQPWRSCQCYASFTDTPIHQTQRNSHTSNAAWGVGILVVLAIVFFATHRDTTPAPAPASIYSGTDLAANLKQGAIQQGYRADRVQVECPDAPRRAGATSVCTVVRNTIAVQVLVTYTDSCALMSLPS